jgi:hypothetical protein
MAYDTPLNARVPEELARRLRLTAAVRDKRACHIVSALLDEGLPQIPELLKQLQPAESGASERPEDGTDDQR